MKGSSVCLALSMVLLAGCSAASTNTKTNDAATYEAYKATVEQLDQVKSYHVSTVSYDHDYASDYEYMEQNEADVMVGKSSDTATETIQMYFVYEDGKKENVTCSSSELEGTAENESGCQLVHRYEDSTLIYSDGYETQAAAHMSQQYFLIMENLEDASYTKEGDTWTISGSSQAGNDYVVTLTVDEEGYPEKFTYAYDGLGISMTRSISDIQK